MQSLQTATPRLIAHGLDIHSPGGRALFHGLDLVLADERVAIVGRNGSGKSTLLSVLAGNRRPRRGRVVHASDPWLVPQLLDPNDLAHQLDRFVSQHPRACEAFAREARDIGLGAIVNPVVQACSVDGILVAQGSRGEQRKLALLLAKHASPELLLVDEPTSDLDREAVTWLCAWLSTYPHGLVAVSHSRELLRQFSDFFLVAESGCRHLHGSYEHLRESLTGEQAREQQRYLRKLNKLERDEQHHDRVCQRRKRKKNVGRLHELRRRTSRARLNEKRSYAQESQARVAKIRHERISTARAWAQAGRRALEISLPLHVLAPVVPPDRGEVLVDLMDVGMCWPRETEGTEPRRRLFEKVDLQLGRERLAVVGPNGAGKTTLLDIMLGRREPTHGMARARHHKIGSIAQAGTDWMRDECLLELIDRHADVKNLDDAARLLLAHRFPLALAERPLASLSPGERVRAALICLFVHTPTLELLVLDEPTYSLDLVGLDALTQALQTWPGGLVVVSHDRDFLQDIGIERELVLG